MVIVPLPELPDNRRRETKVPILRRGRSRRVANNDIFPVRGSTAPGEEGPLHMLFEGFDIFGIHIQYWMPLAAVIATIAITYSAR